MPANTTVKIAAAILFVEAIIVFALSRSSSPQLGNRLTDSSAAPILTLRGASQFGEDHAFTKTLRKFEELVKAYYGKPIEFELSVNSELGLEKDYFSYMSLGIAIDYAIVSPSHMSTFCTAAPLMDMPFLFRDIDHWNRVLELDALAPIADQVAKDADVLLIGYAGGGVRNLIVNRPITNLQELTQLSIRVMGSPIQTRIFQAIKASPTVIAYSEVYNAIQTGVIDAAENEAAGLKQMKFYEVGPEISLTQHAITLRPLTFSGKSLRRLPKDLQRVIIRAGREAGEYGRQLESTQDAAILAQLAEEGKANLHSFTERDLLLELANPVKQQYAREINAAGILASINAVH